MIILCMGILYRALLLAVVITATGSAAIASSRQASEQYDFNVYLDDRLIGNHQVNITRSDSNKSVRVSADFDVRFMYIPVYSYSHESVEHWNDGCLQNIQTRTDDNGDGFYIDTRQSGETLEIETREGVQALDGCVRTFAYWDPELLKSERLLNTQTGEYQPVSITELGIDVLEINGMRQKARRYRLVCEDVTIDLWYADDMRWLALETETGNGTRLRYLPEKLSLAGLEAQR